jgi:hypothetical protein
MTTTPKRYIILILGITINLSLGNIPSATAKNAAIFNNSSVLHNYVFSDFSYESEANLCPNDNIILKSIIDFKTKQVSKIKLPKTINS